MPPPRLFTPAEANQTLPLVRRIVSDILAAGQATKALHLQFGPAVATSPEFQRRLAEMEELVRELEAIGCSFRDWNFELGLVDFPAVIDGEEVLLCWRSDEPSVGHYHGVNAGYAGRRPLPAPLQSPSATG
jgi:hypothetical protein